jgi:hypothetical protein
MATKQLLTGTLDEQCEFLYNMAIEKMEVGNYTGAVYALREVVAHNPGFKDATALLAFVEERKFDQTFLLASAGIGAVVGVALYSWLQPGNDLLLWVYGLGGLFGGYGLGNLIRSFQRSRHGTVDAEANRKRRRKSGN